MYLHEHKDFPDLLRIIESETGIQATLVEKDYWIMHVLYGLKTQGYDFELKGGTSLSKGYGIIDRFSEDIDIHINPPADKKVEVNPKKIKQVHNQSRENYYDGLAVEIKINGIDKITRDHAFDDKEGYFRSGGIRLFFTSYTIPLAGVKEGILLEAGFDTVTPNNALTISSWAYDKAADANIKGLIDNRAIDIVCYSACYTFVEKLQTVATKFRQEQTDHEERPNYMRQYYDLYCLLGRSEILDFLGTDEYQAHKKDRFPKLDYGIPVNENEAFLLSDEKLRARFVQRYQESKGLYYRGQPDFNTILATIQQHLGKL